MSCLLCLKCPKGGGKKRSLTLDSLVASRQGGNRPGKESWAPQLFLRIVHPTCWWASMCPNNPPSFPHLIPALGKSHNYRQRMKGNTKLMMGYLFNPGLHHCRISWLLRGPGASSPGDIHVASQRLLTRTGRKFQEYPRAHSCLPVAQPLEKGKRKRL